MSKRARRESDSGEHDISSINRPAVDSTQPPGKYTQLDLQTQPTATHTIACILPPHDPITFTSYDDYEIHYHKSHVNRCLECGKNFPSSHYLSLHIAENHDSLNSIRRDRGEKTYHCFVEDCEKICSTPQKRRMHLVDKHMFPKNYDFFIVNFGSDNRTSLLRPEGKGQKKSGSQITKAVREEGIVQSTHTSLDMADTMVIEDTEIKDDGDAPAKDVSMDEIADSMAALKFVPKSITFGRGRQRRGLSRN